MNPGIRGAKFAFLQAHRSHDYRWLIKRWRAVARAAGLKMEPYSQVGGHPVYCVRSKHLPASGAIYLSAGIHGDEPGGTEGCIAWAEKNLQTLQRNPFLIFPCLNPWGLINNSRNDDARRDLNRLFQSDEIPSLRAQKEIIKPHQFALALALHEDYDGQGVYIYEVHSAAISWGAELLQAGAKYLPIEGRTRVDGRAFKAGVFRGQKRHFKVFETIGLPETPYLRLYHAERTFTIETPSEFALDLRIRAQVAIIEECVRRIFPEPKAGRTPGRGPSAPVSPPPRRSTARAR